MTTPSRRELVLALAIIATALFLSGIAPYDRFTWFLEVTPVLVGIPVLYFNWHRFALTRLATWLLVVHALILILGGAYTYARVPLGFWMEDWFGFTRNHYDRIGHLAQGFVPAILAREILIRLVRLNRGFWLFLLVTCVCLAISAFYELIEWWTALASGAAADAFLGTQGDVWDTQWDMFLALTGAIAAQLLLGRVHDRQLGVVPANGR